MAFGRRTALPLQGGGMIVFEGSRRQRGGNIFSTIRRMVIPLVKSAAPIAKNLGKDIVKRGLRVGVGAIQDKLKNKDMSLGQALKSRSSKAVDRAMVDYKLAGNEDDDDDVPMPPQTGKGLRRKRKRRAKSAAPRKRRRRTTPKRRRKPKRKPVKRLKRRSINKMKKKKKGTRKPRRITAAAAKRIADIFG